jgi:hypothetical protein
MLLALVSWWYTTGWAGFMSQAGRRSATLLETFSVKLLLGSLFDPFRQISAAQTRGGGLDVQLRAMGDRLFSRVFGAVVRSLFIIIGLAAACSSFVFSLVTVAVWPFIPLLPFVCIGLAATGVHL